MTGRLDYDSMFDHLKQKSVPNLNFLNVGRFKILPTIK